MSGIIVGSDQSDFVRAGCVGPPHKRAIGLNISVDMKAPLGQSLVCRCAHCLGFPMTFAFAPLHGQAASSPFTMPPPKCDNHTRHLDACPLGDEFHGRLALERGERASLYVLGSQACAGFFHGALP